MTAMETADTASTAARMREFQAQRKAMEAAPPSVPAGAETVTKRRELETTLR